MFGIVDDVIARHGVNGENRRGGVYRQIMAGAAGVARFVIDRGADGVIACVERARAEVGTLTLQLPSACTVPV